MQYVCMCVHVLTAGDALANSKVVCIAWGHSVISGSMTINLIIKGFISQILG